MKKHKVQTYVSKTTKDLLLKFAKDHGLSESNVARLLVEAVFNPEFKTKFNFIKEQNEN